MKASKENPIYSVYMINGDKKYNLTSAVISINLSDQEKQLAQSASIELINRRLEDGETICGKLQVRQRIYIYADDGETSDEVFRGYTWTRYHQSELEGTTLTMKCYDNLIYLQESESSFYFSSGYSTESVMRTICNSWGISLNYTYSSITHPKLVLRGSLSDIFMSDVLDKVKQRTGYKYVLTSQKDVLHVKHTGQNSKVYHIGQTHNATMVRYEQTMDGIVTQVVILGKAEQSSGAHPIVAVVRGNTARYGTLQKLQDKKEDISLSDAQAEAQATLKDKGTPRSIYEAQASDIPWIRKGDRVIVNGGHSTNLMLIVTSIDRTIRNTKKTMILTLQEEQK